MRVAARRPVRPAVADDVGQGPAAAQRVLDARRAGEQRVVPRAGAVGLDRPQDQPVGPAQRQHPVEGPLDGRPQVVEEAAVPRAAPVVPHAGGDVGAHVGVELGLLDAAVGPVVVVPAAVRPLGRRPATRRRPRPGGAARRRRAPSPTRRGSTGRSGRRGTTGSSRTRSCSDARCSALARTSAALSTPGRSGRVAAVMPPRLAGRLARPSRRRRGESRRGRGSCRAPATAGGRRSASSAAGGRCPTRGTAGTARTSGWSSSVTPTAHFSHQYGECRAWAWWRAGELQSRPRAAWPSARSPSRCARAHRRRPGRGTRRTASS